MMGFWGERRKFYRSAYHVGQVQQGLLALILQKFDDFGNQSRRALDHLGRFENGDLQALIFLRQRVERASNIMLHLENVLGNPLVQMLTKTSETDEKNRQL